MTSRLGPYTVLGSLAKGSTADVLLAIPDATHLPRRVVIKQLYPHLVGEGDFVRMFLDEVRLQSRLRDDGIVRVFDLDDHDGHFFAVLELTDGPSVAAALRLHHKNSSAVGVPVAVAVAVAARVAAALHVVHTLTDVDGTPLQLVHRDVSPDNVLVSRDGAVRLADFGVARSVVGRDSGLLAAKETTAGTKKGKAIYLAPEQVLGRASTITARTDLYALGATLFTMLTGRPPFSRADGEVALFDAILHTAAPHLSGVVADVDHGLGDLVAALLEKRAADRPADASTVAATLRQWCNNRDIDVVDSVAAFVTGLGLPSLA